MITHSRRLGAALTVAGLFAISMTLAAPASAAESPREVKAQACWTVYETEVTQCFDTDAQMRRAILEQTGSPLIEIAPSSAETARDRIEAPRMSADEFAAAPRAIYVLGVLYDEAYAAPGTSFTLTTTYSSLCTAYFYNFNTLSPLIDDRTSSMQAYGTCKIRISEYTNQGGVYYGPAAGYTSYVGSVMNDKASSSYVTG